MESGPKIAAPRPAIEGRQPPRATIEDTKVPIRGLFALIPLLAHLNLAALRALYHPVDFAAGLRSLFLLSSLLSLISHISATPLEVTAPRGLKPVLFSTFYCPT